MDERGIPYQRQTPVPAIYKARKLKDHRLDLVVAGKVVVELKAVDRTAKIVERTLLSVAKLAR